MDYKHICISVHLPVFTILPGRALPSKIKKKITYLVFNKTNLAKFKCRSVTAWLDSENLLDAYLMYKMFISQVQMDPFQLL